MKDGRIRVLHVLQTIGIGGMEKRILRLCKGLDPKRYDIHAVTLRQTDGASIDWPEDQRHYYPIEPGLHLDKLLGLSRLMRDGCYDIVHSHNWATMLYGVLAARLARVPVVLHGEHGLNADDRQGISFKREMVATAIAHTATRIVAVNGFIKKQSEERWKLKPCSVVNIPNGVDLTRFTPKPRSRLNNEELVIGTVARFDPIKNLHCIIRGFDLFKQNNPARKSSLVLVGEGPLMKELQAFAASLSCAQDIQFPGETNSPENWYSRFDIYINGSFSEGMSNTILEGMACGLPVVASDVPGNRDWLEDGINALFFESDNAQELSRTLTTLADNPAKMQSMGNENHHRAQLSYDNQAFISRYDQLYQQLLKE